MSPVAEVESQLLRLRNTRFWGLPSSQPIVSRSSGMLSLPLFHPDNEVKVGGENKLDEIVKNQLLR